jgi:sporulation related protein
MRRTWSVLTVLIAALALGSCALPPALVVASYSADIVSYAATGKTVTDHAYSYVARSDCSFIRVLKRKPICVDEPGNAPEKIDVAAASIPERKPVHDRRVEIGSFLDPANAERTRARYAEFNAVVVPATVHGQHFHRVIAGPMSPEEASALNAKLATAVTFAPRHVERG